MTSELFEIAKNCFEEGLKEADPSARVLAELEKSPVGDVSGRSILISFGKAAVAMTKAAVTKEKFDEAIMVTNHENFEQIEGVDCFSASHPTPDENGLKASQHIIERLKSTTEQDHVLVLISGGGSALLPSMREPITLEEKSELNDILLAAGLSIELVNTIRRRTSELKGGGMARKAMPATVRSLVISDVLSNDLSAIASGPTVPCTDASTAAEDILQINGLWNRVPESVRTVCKSPKRKDTFQLDAKIIASNQNSVDAMVRAIPVGYQIERTVRPLIGEVQQVAQFIVGKMRSAKPNSVLIFGGEPTVLLTGDGKGGRNQELALTLAHELHESPLALPWVFLSAGTDGIDGPTDAAGGLVSDSSIEKALKKQIDVSEQLARNNSYPVLQEIGDLFLTGATGTNVADLMIAVVGNRT